MPRTAPYNRPNARGKFPAVVDRELLDPMGYNRFTLACGHIVEAFADYTSRRLKCEVCTKAAIESKAGK